jgi:hypothetical protein
MTRIVACGCSLKENVNGVNSVSEWMNEDTIERNE